MPSGKLAKSDSQLERMVKESLENLSQLDDDDDDDDIEVTNDNNEI